MWLAELAGRALWSLSDPYWQFVGAMVSMLALVAGLIRVCSKLDRWQNTRNRT